MVQKKRNKVRIIAGTHRGRLVSFPDAEGLRPTADSVRERLFSWLGGDLTGKSVLDLFAGSGVMAFEAASRHAGKVVAVEFDAKTAQSIRSNRETLGLDAVEVVRQDALHYLTHSSSVFDIVILDPPFSWHKWPELLQVLPPRLAAGALVYTEAAELPDTGEILPRIREGRSGMSRYGLSEYAKPGKAGTGAGEEG